MRNYFLPDEPRRTPKIDVSAPMHLSLAAALSVPNPPRTNRRLRRRGVGFVWAPAAYPKRHTICHVCDRRTYTSEAGTCRRCFLDGEGPFYEVTF